MKKFKIWWRQFWCGHTHNDWFIRTSETSGYQKCEDCGRITKEEHDVRCLIPFEKAKKLHLKKVNK
jgi:hypothetical protein